MLSERARKVAERIRDGEFRPSFHPLLAEICSEVLGPKVYRCTWCKRVATNPEGLICSCGGEWRYFQNDQYRVASGPMPFTPEVLGEMVRNVWIRWAKLQPNPKESWLVTYHELPEPDKQVDRWIGEEICRATMLFIAATNGSPLNDHESEAKINRIVADVELKIGVGHTAWDMVNPAEIVRAAREAK